MIMSVKRKKTVLRTVRLNQELDSILRDDAEKSDLTVNGLINRIMTKYVEWDRHTERFGFISFARQTFKSILEEVDECKIEQIATNTASPTLKAVTLFWFKELKAETLLKTISNYCKYSGLGTSEIKVDGAQCIITFHHDLGRKYSIYLKNAIGQFVKTTLGLVPKTEIAHDMLFVSFHMPPSKSTEK
jgi:predicted DNA-binding ribbon-helix-helix protein